MRYMIIEGIFFSAIFLLAKIYPIHADVNSNVSEQHDYEDRPRVDLWNTQSPQYYRHCYLKRRIGFGSVTNRQTRGIRQCTESFIQIIPLVKDSGFLRYPGRGLELAAAIS